MILISCSSANPHIFRIVHAASSCRVWLRNVNRKTYVHIKKDATGKFQLTTDEVVPWGDDALITLHFSKENGTYSIQASNGQFLSADGQLKDSISADTQFIFEFQGAQVALKSNTGSEFMMLLSRTHLLTLPKSAWCIV
jgi:hypothetical protein